MKKLILIPFLFLSITANASPIVYGTTYAQNGTVTSTNLNGNFTNVSQVVNGGLDNTNANTTSGYRFYQTVAVLPSAGSQGSVYFLTTDNSLNFDTGGSYIKSVATTTPSTGYIPYYNSGWANLVPGAQYLPLVSNGVSSLPTYQTLTAHAGGTNADLSASTQGSVAYFPSTGTMGSLSAGTSGQVLTTQGASANPIWANSLSSVSNYGTSTSSSTPVQGTALKIAYGTGVSVSAGSSTSITNLPFSSSSSYSCTVSENDSATTDEARGSLGFTYASGSSAAMYNTDNTTRTGAWICVGT